MVIRASLQLPDNLTVREKTQITLTFGVLLARKEALIPEDTPLAKTSCQQYYADDNRNIIVW